MKCKLCDVRLINRGDKRISNDTIKRKVECPSCGTVKTYEKVYPKSFVKKWKIVPTKEGHVVNPKIKTTTTKKKVFHPFEKIFPPQGVLKMSEAKLDGVR